MVLLIILFAILVQFQYTFPRLGLLLEQYILLFHIRILKFHIFLFRITVFCFKLVDPSPYKSYSIILNAGASFFSDSFLSTYFCALFVWLLTLFLRHRVYSSDRAVSEISVFLARYRYFPIYMYTSCSFPIHILISLYVILSVSPYVFGGYFW